MELDYQSILPRCGLRLSVDDARALHETALGIEAKTIVEIGAGGGCSSMVLGNVAKHTGGHLYTIDPRPEPRWQINIDSLGLGQYVTLIQKASPWIDPSSVHTPIDYLFIDGDHRSKYVITDYQYWQKFVRIGGLIAFHDWTGTRGGMEQIRRAVVIILETDPLREIARVEGNGMGLIIFRKLVGEWMIPAF